MDERGRVTIPIYLREAADLIPGSWVEVAADPGFVDMKCRGLTVRKAF